MGEPAATTTTAAATTTTASDGNNGGGGCCPLFGGTTGHMTAAIRRRYLEREIREGRMPAATIDDPSVLTLVATTTTAPTAATAHNDSNCNDDDVEPPLYFWQLHSLIGDEPITELTEAFYTRLFRDEEEWFRVGFGRPNVKYHAVFLCMALLDCFGGGKMYSGGEERLRDIHDRTVGPDAKHFLMTEDGAAKWSGHMTAALDAVQRSRNLDLVDVRIRPALDEFFTFMMNQYAQAYNFDASNVSFSSTNSTSSKSTTSPPVPALVWEEG